MKNKKYFSFILFIFLSTTLFAQQKENRQQKFIPPVVKTILGNRSGIDTVSKEAGIHLIALPLKVIDERNIVYKLITYQFLYRRKGFLENPETGKVESSFTIVSQRFDHTPLPAVWVTNIKDELKSQEEFYFFDVLVQDKQGRNFFAPSLKLIIK